MKCLGPKKMRLIPDGDRGITKGCVKKTVAGGSVVGFRDLKLEFWHEIFSTTSLGIIFECPIVKSVKSIIQQRGLRQQENAQIDIHILPALMRKKLQIYYN